tara:strand:+ start:148 stop:1668 length:1521 start_codon:yes stop_codon:yes gene_type:complete
MGIKEIILKELLFEAKKKKAKKDACYHKVKSRYDVWPSAYASGALVKCRKVGAKNWGKSKKESEEIENHNLITEKKKGKRKLTKKASSESNLGDWFKRKGAKGSSGGWVDCNAPDGKGGYKSCGRKEGEERSKYPACRPTKAACKDKGKGKSWGKKAKKESISEIIKTLIKEEYGRNYTIDSLYDVIYDELLNIPSQSGNGTIIDDFKMLMKSPIGGVENFMMPHNKDESGTSDGLFYDYDEEMVMQQGPHGLLSMIIFPKLKEMGIIKGPLKEPNELKVLNRIGSLFYRDIRPLLSNDSDMMGREFYDIDDDGNPIEESVISESLQYHIDRNIPLVENIYRYGSESFFNLINETRELYKRGEIDLCLADKELLQTNIGEKSMFEGKEVWLDIPMENIEVLSEDDKFKGKKSGSPTRDTSGGKAYKVYVAGCSKKTDSNPRGIKLIRFGSGGLKAKLSNKQAKKSYNARHGCAEGRHNDKCKAGYWSCRLPRYAKKLGLSGGGTWW